MKIEDLLTLAIDTHASDLHLSAGLAPILRIDGELITSAFPTLTSLQIQDLLSKLLNEEQFQQCKQGLDLDFSFEFQKLGRFRGTVFRQARGTAAVLRYIPAAIPSLASLNLPPILKKLTRLKQGLILVAGPTGSGKTTTLAAMIDELNNSSAQHILTLEDPIEFIHSPKKSIINQREIYRDSLSFAAALKSALRADPEVILIGELRDLETIRLALTAAETGHLVLATLHAHSAVNSIYRLIDVFSGKEKALVRTQLAQALQAVVAQRLLKKIGGGREAIVEIMLANTAVSNLIRDNKLAQLYSAIQLGKTQGMQTFEQHIKQLNEAGLQVALEDNELFSLS